MSQRMRARNDRIIALAKAINQRRLEFGARNSNEVFKRDGAVSRILENDPDYTPHRPRKINKARRPVVNPGIFTVKDIADRLHTTVGSLLGEKGLRSRSTTAGGCATSSLFYPSASRSTIRFSMTREAAGPDPPPPGGRADYGVTVRVNTS